MKEKIKKLILFSLWLIVFLAFAKDVCAAEQYSGEKYKEYLNSYDLSFFEKTLDRDTYSFLDELDLNGFDVDSISSLSFEDVMNIVKKILVEKAENPLKGLVSVLIFVMLSSLFQSLKSDSSAMSSLYSTVCAVVISLILIAETGAAISLCCSSIKTASNFIFAFVPVFGAITAASGEVSASFSTNTMLLALAQGLSMLSSNIFVPLANAFLAVGVCSGIRAELNLERLVSEMKKVITTSVSFISGAFVSILSIKTNISQRADALGIRSLRFAINSVVPVVGGALSEGLLSIQSYSSLIKSSVGITGITAIALVFLPGIAETVLWRLSLAAGLTVCDIFGERSVKLILCAFKDTMLILNVILIVSALTSVISFGVLVSAGNG